MLRKPTAAVIMFPGTNCEQEAVLALSRNGFEPTLLRWNEVKSLTKYAAIVIAGGFSFEDRGRAGLIASHDPVMKAVAAAARSGRVVLGICNGAQVLIETGLVPNGQFGRSTVALARNHFSAGESYFINKWVTLNSPAPRGSNAFNDFAGTIRMPLAHGEGRFATQDPELIQKIVMNSQNAFCYSTESGDITPKANPNGAILNLAGLTNPAGNVLALMPHPERSKDGDKIFQSMQKWILKKSKVKNQKLKLAVRIPRTNLIKKPKFTAELFIRLTITDNEALSVQQVLEEHGLSLTLTKYRYISLQKKISKKHLEALIRSGDILNTEKETVFVKVGGKTFHFSKNKGLVPDSFRLPRERVLAVDVGPPRRTSRGVLWVLSGGSKVSFAKATRGHFFHHPAAQDLVQI